MTEEAIKYSENLQGFLDVVKASKVEEIQFDIDKKPAFEKAKLPFDFKYCHAIKVVTSSGSFIVHTSMTNSGLDTFWFTTKTRDNKPFESNLQINLNIKTVLIKNGFNDLPFKIELNFGTNKIFIYAAEFYDRTDGKVDCKINDEMILVFEKQNDAEKFEKLINYN